jgi:hypothetical protein
LVASISEVSLTERHFPDFTPLRTTFWPFSCFGLSSRGLHFPCR